MSDPVEFVAYKLDKVFDITEDDVATVALTAVVEDGWRIVRTEERCTWCGGRRDELVEDGCDHSEWWDPAKPDPIVEEWTP